MHTNNGHFVLLHGGQHLVQLLLRGRILHLTQVILLELHWDTSSLRGGGGGARIPKSRGEVACSKSAPPLPILPPTIPRSLAPSRGAASPGGLTLNTSLTACISSGPTPSPGSMVTGKAPSTFTSSACERARRGLHLQQAAARGSRGLGIGGKGCQRGRGRGGRSPDSARRPGSRRRWPGSSMARGSGQRSAPATDRQTEEGP